VGALDNPSFVDLAGLDELPAKGFIVREHGELEVLIAQFKGDVFAVENLCSHAFARFDEGRLRGFRLMCPLHGACFDIRSGEAMGLPATGPIRSFDVRVENGRVLVGMDGSAGDEPGAEFP
jgi:3-phenylpropionate/trans-cinnamate dioxygenase ferredoxin subunit